ncbi:MAG: hypothetical protein JXN10_00555 [Clostridia bacterium]|nr:hypothetical protein [Clostridia bacterium]MBN2881988.1 hypothetical protein [Clostridia bacterium]
MDRTKALEVLGLDETTDREKIESRYINLMRRVKNGEALDKKGIEEAYDLLTGRVIETVEAGKLALFYRKMMFDYKGWIIMGIIVLSVVTMIIVPIFTRRVPDLTISFAGEYGTKNLDDFDEYMQQELPETSDILVEVMYLDETGESGEFDTGGRTRLTAILLTNEADILIMDDVTFNYVRQEDALMILDDILVDLGLDLDSKSLIYGIDFKTGEKKVFGINITGNQLVEDAIFGDKMQILCIAENSGHLDAAKKAIEIILKDRRE